MSTDPAVAAEIDAAKRRADAIAAIVRDVCPLDPEQARAVRALLRPTERPRTAGER